MSRCFKIILTVCFCLNVLSCYSSDTLIHKFDAFISTAVGRNITGAVGVLITGDSTFQKLYGYADLEQRKAVNEQTRFRLGSVSKIFTALAILQMEEKGFFSIDDPIDKYVDPGLYSNPFKQPITIFHLLTHTAGFGENYLFMASKERKGALSIKQYLQKLNLTVVYEPGSVFSYSNFGYGLLGRIIENRSGMSYADYVKRNILVPLKMTDSYLDPPFTLAALPYRKTNNGFTVLPFDHLNMFPAGAIWSTVIDMEKFLRMMIFQDQLLRKETFEKMKNRNVRFHPHVKGFGLSLFEFNTTPPIFYGHGGGWRGYNAYIMFNNELKTGYVVCTNTENPRAFVDPLAVKFLQWTVGADEKEDAKFLIDINSLKAYEGTYRNVRTPLHDKTAWMFKAFVNKEKRLSVDNKININKKEYRLAVDSLLIPEDNNEPVFTFFRRNNNQYLYSDPLETYEKIGFFQTATFLRILLMVMLFTGILAVVEAYKRRKLSLVNRIDFVLSIGIFLLLISYLTGLAMNFEANLFYGYSTYLKMFAFCIYTLLFLRACFLVYQIFRNHNRIAALVYLSLFTFSILYLNII